MTLLSHFAIAAKCDHQFLGLLPWYHYLQLDQNCEVINFVLLGSHSSILLVGLAIIDDLLRVAGLLAVVFIIIAGFRFITSQGSPDEAAKARGAIINALVGLGITMVAIVFVSFLGNSLGGTVSYAGTAGGGVQWSLLPHLPGADTGAIIPTILTILFNIMGAVAFVVIVIGGFQYVTSQGEPQAVNKAKNTIMYALIGLVVAILAQSIVVFVVSRLF